MSLGVNTIAWTVLLALIVHSDGLFARSEKTADPVKIAWAREYSSGLETPDDQAAAIAVDRDGNVYVTGSSDTVDTGFDYVTIKYDALGNEEWIARYNGPGNYTDRAYDLAVDSAGNVFVTGGSAGIGTRGDFATVKYNASGVEQWVARYDGPEHYSDAGFALALDDSGNVYVTGPSHTVWDSDDFITVKYDPSGIEQWVTRYNGPANDRDIAYDLAVDDSGNVFVTGGSHGSSTSFDYDYATIKYDAAGIERWVVRYKSTGTGEDRPSALALDDSGNVYITGYSKEADASDYATVKYSTSGVEQWVARYNGPGGSVDMAYALALNDSGHIYVTGQSIGSTQWTDYATVKYDASGEELWVARYDGPGSRFDYGIDLALDRSGNIYVTGWSDSAGWSVDIATIKYDPSGSEEWVMRYDGTENDHDEPEAITIDEHGSIYVTGWSSRGRGWAYTTLKYVQAPVTAVEFHPAAPAEFHLFQNYANPFNPSTTIRYQLPERSYVTLMLFNLLGEEVATLVSEIQESGYKSVKFDATGQPSGVYFYRLTAGRYVGTKKTLLVR